MEIFSVDPKVWKTDDPLIQDLKNGRISHENFQKILHMSPDMPYELHNNKLVYLPPEEMEKRRLNFLTTQKGFLINSGGINGAMVYHQRDIFCRIFPEIKEILEQAIKKAEAEKCPTCQIGKEMGPVMEKIGKLRGDGRDLSEIEHVFKEYPYRNFTMMWLRNQPFEIKDSDIVIPPFLNKKAVGMLPEQTTDEHGLPLLEGCAECVHKHLADAYVLATEILQGYTPDKGYRHFDRLVGNLVSAEIEALKFNPALAMKIRLFRLKITGQKQDAPTPPQPAGN